MFQGYHGVFCGACDDTHGKAKSGSCVHCSPKWNHMAMATFLALWSTGIIAFVLRRALSPGGSDGIQQKDEKTGSCSLILKSDQGMGLESNILKESKERHMDTEDAISSVKKVQSWKSARDIVEIPEDVPSSLDTKSYVSEIGKVSNRNAE